MDQATRHITEGLQKAIGAESDGYHFYTLAARAVQDQKGKEVLGRLAEEELEHMRFLKTQYQSFLEHGRPDGEAKLGARKELFGASPIFSKAIRSRIGSAHLEMSALSIGIQLELASEQFYRREAENSPDPRVNSFYRELAEWESGHYRALLRQQEALKEEYWSKGGFAPF